MFIFLYLIIFSFAYALSTETIQYINQFTWLIASDFSRYTISAVWIGECWTTRLENTEGTLLIMGEEKARVRVFARCQTKVRRILVGNANGGAVQAFSCREAPDTSAERKRSQASMTQAQEECESQQNEPCSWVAHLTASICQRRLKQLIVLTGTFINFGLLWRTRQNFLAFFMSLTSSLEPQNATKKEFNCIMLEMCVL